MIEFHAVWIWDVRSFQSSDVREGPLRTVPRMWLPWRGLPPTYVRWEEVSRKWTLTWLEGQRTVGSMFSKDDGRFLFPIPFVLCFPRARKGLGDGFSWAGIILCWVAEGGLGLNTYEHPRRGEFSRVDLGDGFG